MSDNNNWPDPARPGVPMNPERDGWHWLLDGNHEPYLLRWGSDNQRWGDYPGSSATDLAEFGIGYLGPCLTPAEVDARVKEAKRDALEEAIQAAANSTHRREIIEAIRALKGEGDE